MRLLTAKLSARAGHDTTIFCGEERLEKPWRTLMYGKSYAETGVDADDCARLLRTTEQLSESLSSAEALCLICDSSFLSADAVATLVNNSPKLQRLVLLSRIGVTRAKPTLFGLGGDDMAMLECEAAIRQKAQARDVDLSIIRAGTLKGGGPGEVENNVVVSGTELGLSKPFYDGIGELETYLVTQSYDRFTLGASCQLGDPLDLPNPLIRAAKKGSFEPCDEEVGRIAAAAALVHALSYETAVELTVSAAKAESPPTSEEWEAMFDSVRT